MAPKTTPCQPRSRRFTGVSLYNYRKILAGVYPGHTSFDSLQTGDSLLNLTGNQGAALVIGAYIAIEIIVNDIGCVTDIDTVQDLQRAQALIDARR